MSRFRSLWQASFNAAKRAFAWNIEDLMPPMEINIFSFNSKDELKRWHLYSDSEYGGLSSASLEIKECDTGYKENLELDNKQASYKHPALLLAYFQAAIEDHVGRLAFRKVGPKVHVLKTGIFYGNLSLDISEDSPWRMKRSGFCGMRSKKFDGFMDLDAYDMVTMKLRGDGRCYISTIYTENWVNSPAQEEDNSWQAFVVAPKDEWHVVKIPLEQYLPTWRGNVISSEMEMNPARVVGMSLSVNAEGGVPGTKSGPGDFSLEIDWIKALRTQN